MQGHLQARTHRDALGLVLLLFRLEGELDEELLQLLVAVIDAELLEAAGEQKSSQRVKGTQDQEWGGVDSTRPLSSRG